MSSAWEVQRPTTPRTHQSEFKLSTTRGDNPQTPRSKKAPSASPTTSTKIFEDGPNGSEKKAVSRDYEITEKLGVGAFGVVKKGKDRRTGKEVAIKCINKKDCKVEELRSEVKLLRLLNGYPGIVILENVYESKDKVNIIMELITGGELFEAIIENESYSEKDASDLIKQIVTTVDFIHSKNVVHRDLKPENLLFEKKGSNSLKLIDFGIATILEDGQKLMAVVGSRTYMAPEIDQRVGYGKPVDMYAIGVIMYILLCGYPPFDYDQGIYELAFNSPEWDGISQTAKDVIVNLLDENPDNRYNSHQLLSHQWVGGKSTPQTPIHNNIHNTIKNYMTISQAKTKMATGRDRRTSIYGLFNIARDKKKSELAPLNETGASSSATTTTTTTSSSTDNSSYPPEVKLAQNLKQDLRLHSKGFQKLKDTIQVLQNETQNDILKEQLEKTMEEVNFLNNAYKELVDGVLPNLNKLCK
eukprot:TRINITY_DN10465_c0_g1_i1.p1 TRINITY_DN10465_c0_g1~~TRINITY_DN10465_c0_g1_i1.p1  ORF type:complete len:471 (-),score=126.23 TRINITY_DN10465_c0_g1_i1:160-1572(-)